MKYLFIDKNTWGYYDDELKLLGDYDSELGNIYAVKIIKHDKKLNAFFIEYDKKKTGFLNNTPSTQDLKPSDEIPVQMTKEPIGDRYPKSTTKITVETENPEYTNGDKLTFEGKQKYKDIDDFKQKYTSTGIVGENFFKQERVQQEKETNFILNKLRHIGIERKFLLIPKPLHKKNPVDKITQEEDVDYLITNDKIVYRQYKGISNVKFDENCDYNYDNLINRGTIDKNLEIIELDNNAEIVIQKTEATWAVDVNSSQMVVNEDHFHELNIKALKKIHQMIYSKKMVGMVIADCIREDDNKKLSDFIKDEFCELNINFRGPSSLNLLEFIVKPDK